MKFFIFSFLSLLQISLCAQFITPIEPAPADKAVVYFVRTSIDGWATKFTYFDGTKVIGRQKGRKYFRYECEPGEHLFWAKFENRDYVQANLEAGKIYIINVIPQTGFVATAVKLEPVNSPDYKFLNRIKKVLNDEDRRVTFTDEELSEWQKEFDKASVKGVDHGESKLGMNKTELLEGYSFSPMDLRF